MESVFEAYVARILKQQLPVSLHLREQARSKALVHFNGYPCQLIINSWEQGLSWYIALEDETHQPVLFAEPSMLSTAAGSTRN